MLYYDESKRGKKKRNWLVMEKEKNSCVRWEIKKGERERKVNGRCMQKSQVASHLPAREIIWHSFVTYQQHHEKKRIVIHANHSQKRNHATTLPLIKKKLLAPSIRISISIFREVIRHSGLIFNKIVCFQDLDQYSLDSMCSAWNSPANVIGYFIFETFML